MSHAADRLPMSDVVLRLNARGSTDPGVPQASAVLSRRQQAIDEASPTFGCEAIASTPPRTGADMNPTPSHLRLDRLQRECAGATPQALVLAAALCLLAVMFGVGSILV